LVITNVKWLLSIAKGLICLAEIFVLKLNEGVELIEELTKFAKKESIDYGLLISAKGMLKKIDLITNTGENKQHFKEKCDIDSISGEIKKLNNGKYDVSVRAALSSNGFSSKSGKILKGFVFGNLEIQMRKVNVSKIIEA
jgi:predicted DNA-binding protein with PD1-like motif